jgi:two-component system response regulator HydG
MAQQPEPTHHVLLVERAVDERARLARRLEEAGFAVCTAVDHDEACRALLQRPFDLVVTDLAQSAAGSGDVLSDLRRVQPAAGIVVITDHGSVNAAVAAMKAGVYDYLTKPVDPEHLVWVLRKALEHQRLRRQVAFLQEQFEEKAGVRQIVAVSSSMKQVLRTIHKVAMSDATIIVEGESGTGKELMAKLIHHRSNRAASPFLAVNCGAMPETLLERELFGHVRGAFTGAHRDQKGLFEAAHGGTLLLDEVAETSAGFQVKLLRVLQERTIRRLGDTREVPVNVRIIAASNQNLADRVRRGEFRRDLFFRLHVIPVRLPPLRERREDILPLAESFLDRIANRLGRSAPRMTEAARALLLQHEWPGNVRELENVLERAVILSHGHVIDVKELLLDSGGESECAAGGPEEGVDLSLAEAERRHILRVLTRCGNNKRQAARVLQIGYNTLWRKLKAYGVA